MKPLRIFYASHHTPNPAVPDSRLWYNNLFLPLVALGNDLVPFEFDLSPCFRDLDAAYPEQKVLIQESQSRLEDALLRQIRAAHAKKPIDVFFSYFYSRCARPEAIKEIRSMGICTVNLYCNASHQFHLIEEVAPAFDYCMVPEKLCLDAYRRIGARPIFCQLGANPDIYQPQKLPQDYEVTFVGQKYGNRPHYIRSMIDAGIDVRVWGPGWNSKGGIIGALERKSTREVGMMLTSLDGWSRILRKAGSLVGSPNAPIVPPERIGPPLNDDELIKMYARSKISLGFSACGETFKSGKPIFQVRLRDIEAPMSGAFYMPQRFDELVEFFEPGKEMVFYEDEADLIEKARYYLVHDSERERIREAGMRRARHEHTWQKRFVYFFSEIGLG